MKYARTENNIVVQTIGNDPANLFAPEYAGLFRPCGNDVQAGWLDDGATFTAPPPAPPVIPQSVTMRQARLALMGAGKLATVNAAIAGMAGVQGEAARIEWEFSSEVKRGQPLVVSMGQVLGLNAEQLDALFTTASGL